MNILAQPSLYRDLLPSLHNLIIEHHEKFVEFYLKSADDVNTFINIHLGVHWIEMIQDFGMPIFFSTMHWEPKHKQLNLLKLHQTNNHNHSRDILSKEIMKQIGLTFIKNPSNEKQVISFVKSKNLPNLSLEIQELIINQLGIDNIDFENEIKYVKKLKQDGYKLTPNSDVMINGENDMIWIAHIENIIAFIPKNHSTNFTFCEIRWYNENNISLKSLKRYTLNKVTLSNRKDLIPISTVFFPVLVYLIEKNLYVSTVYFVNKMYNGVWDF